MDYGPSTIYTNDFFWHFNCKKYIIYSHKTDVLYFFVMRADSLLGARGDARGRRKNEMHRQNLR